MKEFERRRATFGWWVRVMLLRCVPLAAFFIAPVAFCSGFISADSLAMTRSQHSATLLPSGDVLIVGGFGGAGRLASAELYDPLPDTWRTVQSMHYARWSHSATLLSSGKVLVAGGGDGGSIAAAELYDPASDSWSLAGVLGNARWLHSATLLASGRVLLVGGVKGIQELWSTELYDPSTNTWAPGPALGSARYSHTATRLQSGKVLVVGGYYGQYLSSAELYDPVANTWVGAGSLATGRGRHTATLLPSGKVLVTGGFGGNGNFVADTELYDPATNTWAPAGALSQPRDSHTATLLASGKVLIVGGNGNNAVVSRAELYDPASNTWGSAGTVIAPRQLHTATLLSSGRVMIAAGADSDGSWIASTELFDPDTTTTVSIESVLPAITVAGQSYAINFTVNGVPTPPTGSVTIIDDQGASCGPVVLSSGAGTCSLRSMSAGSRSLTASYTPDSGAFAPSSATATHQVDRANTSISGFATPNPSVWGQDVSYTAYVSKVAPAYVNLVGSVLVSDGVNSCTAAVSDGAASCSLVPSAVGSYSMSLKYLGDDNSNPSSTVIPGTVSQAYTNVAMLPITPSSVVVAQPVTLSADVAVSLPGVGPATGTVSINNGRDGCGAAVDASGHAVCVAKFKTAGWYSVHAYYAGDPHYFPSSSGNVQLNVDPASTTTVIVERTPNTSTVGEAVNFAFSAAAVAPSMGIPAGSVTVSDGSQSCIGTLDVAGNGTCAITFSSAGTHHLKATYGGTINSYFGSTSPNLDHVVNRASTIVAITGHAPDPSIPVQSISVVSTLAVASPGVGTPTGPVTIGDGVDSCTIPQGGTGCALVLTTRGLRTLTATYAGDSNFNASSAQVTHHVNRLPVLVAATYATNDDSSLEVAAVQGLLAQASDPDGDALVIANAGTLTATGIGGTVVLNADGGFTYTPPAFAHGDASFDYVVGDGYESVTATATIAVNFVNHAPTFTLATLPDWLAGSSGTKTQAGFASVTDFGAPNEAGQHLLAWHVRALGDPNAVVSNVTIALDGTLAYTLSGRAGTATFGVKLQDDGGTANGGDDTSGEQVFTISVAAGIDLSISIDNDSDFVAGGMPVEYTIVVLNAGPNDAVGAKVKDLLPANLVDAVWSCTADTGASCTPAGSGDIDDVVILPSGARLTYSSIATVLANPEVEVEHTVSVMGPEDVPDLNSANNTATRYNTVGLFFDGFDRETAEAATHTQSHAWAVKRSRPIGPP